LISYQQETVGREGRLFFGAPLYICRCLSFHVASDYVVVSCGQIC